MNPTATRLLLALALTALLVFAAVATGSATGHGDTQAAIPLFKRTVKLNVAFCVEVAGSKYELERLGIDPAN